MQQALLANWHLAHAGVEPDHVREVTTLLGARLARERDFYVAMDIRKAYLSVVPRLSAASEIKAQAAALRTKLEREVSDFDRVLVPAYGAIAAQLPDAADRRAALVFLRNRLRDDDHVNSTGETIEAYQTAWERMADAAFLKSEASALRASCRDHQYADHCDALMYVYGLVVGRMSEASDIRDEASALRTWLAQAHTGQGTAIVQAYRTVIARMVDVPDFGPEVTALRSHLEQEPDSELGKIFADAYAVLAARMRAEPGLRSAAVLLRARVERLVSGGSVGSQGADASPADMQERGRFERAVQAYGRIVVRLSQAADVKAEAEALRLLAGRQQDSEVIESLLRPYVALATRLKQDADIKLEVAAVRALTLQVHSDASLVRHFAYVYATLIMCLENPVDIHAEALILKQRLSRLVAKPHTAGTGPDGDPNIVRLDTVADAKVVWTALREQMQAEQMGHIVASFDRANALALMLLDQEAELKNEDIFLQVGTTQQRRDMQATELARSISQAYASAAARLEDPVQARRAEAYLRARPELPGRREHLAYAYAAVAVRLTDAADIKRAAAFLRARLPEAIEGDLSSTLAKAYAAVVSRLFDVADRRAEIDALQEQLKRTRPFGMERHDLEDYSQAYAILAARAYPAAELEAAGRAPRGQLERAGSSRETQRVGYWYGLPQRALLSHADKSRHRDAVAAILTLAGHPHLEEKSDLLVALKPVSKRDFGNNLLDAVQWARRTSPNNVVLF